RPGRQSAGQKNGVENRRVRQSGALLRVRFLADDGHYRDHGGAVGGGAQLPFRLAHAHDGRGGLPPVVHRATGPHPPPLLFRLPPWRNSVDRFGRRGAGGVQPGGVRCVLHRLRRRGLRRHRPVLYLTFSVALAPSNRVRESLCIIRAWTTSCSGPARETWSRSAAAFWPT